jgi:deazaflavin-dependent oxidoreductase (nitroreductase family)
MSETAPRLPPRWVIRSAWAVHRAVYSITGGRLGLRSAPPGRAGMLRLRTIGRRTGEERRAILGYQEDGANIVLVAMNGWGDPEPAWWLNLQGHPDARVDLANGSRDVTARVARGDERSRLWARLAGPFGNLDRYAALRSRETAIVILEPRSDR